MKKWLRAALGAVVVVVVALLALITWYTLVSPFSAIDPKGKNNWLYAAQLLGLLWLAPTLVTLIISTLFARFSSQHAPGYQLILTDLLSALLGSGLGFTILITCLGENIKVLFLALWMQYLVIALMWMLMVVLASYVVRKWVIKRHV